jgi:hypothetical protein
MHVHVRERIRRDSIKKGIPFRLQKHRAMADRDREKLKIKKKQEMEKG